MRPHEVMTYLGLKDKFLLGENPDISQRVSNLNLDQYKYISN